MSNLEGIYLCKFITVGMMLELLSSSSSSTESQPLSTAGNQLTGDIEPFLNGNVDSSNLKVFSLCKSVFFRFDVGLCVNQESTMPFSQFEPYFSASGGNGLSGSIPPSVGIMTSLVDLSLCTLLEKIPLFFAKCMSHLLTLKPGPDFVVKPRIA